MILRVCEVFDISLVISLYESANTVESASIDGLVKFSRLGGAARACDDHPIKEHKISLWKHN
jgi:hypothetical protein